MTIVIVIIIALITIPFMVQSWSRTNEVGHHRNKCSYCGKRLKKVGPKYATTCKACGKTQPWAKV